jgi:hypothetical protein
MKVPELTTIKVPVQVRDRFAAAARVHGVTVRALLDQLSCQVADATLMERVAQQMRQLRENDRLSWNDYLAEGQQ